MNKGKLIIKKLFNKIKKIKLSNDAKEILNISFLTNSYYPDQNITPEEFKILEDFKNEHVQNNPEDHGMPVEEFVLLLSRTFAFFPK